MNHNPLENKSFDERRQQGRKFADRLDREISKDHQSRDEFFNQIYRNASGDGAQVPWADLAPKPELTRWLEENPGNGLNAIDIACGLGDNTVAIAGAGYVTTGFDLSSEAIEWAKKRFSNSKVNFQTADLFDLPPNWNENFDLVFECYTLQALPPDRLEFVASAIASLVKPGGTLLVYSRISIEGKQVDGPPWPLSEYQYTIFEKMGFDCVKKQHFIIERPDKTIPHIFMQLKKMPA